MHRRDDQLKNHDLNHKAERPAFFDISALKTNIFGPLSLQISAGECVSIRGKSGSGKSIFLRAIADLDSNEGSVTLDGIERSRIPAFEWRRKVMLVPAESGWWADSVREHFEDIEAAKVLLDVLVLPPEILDWQVSRLSTGERQRLAIARALSLSPSVLLLDEPTAALDPQATKFVEEIMRRQMAAGISIILVTHDEAQARRMANRAFVLEDNVLVLDGRDDLK
jgi:ABC-type iron transport system FetAB ATPase subunit